MQISQTFWDFFLFFLFFFSFFFFFFSFLFLAKATFGDNVPKISLSEIMDRDTNNSGFATMDWYNRHPQLARSLDWYNRNLYNSVFGTIDWNNRHPQLGLWTIMDWYVRNTKISAFGAMDWYITETPNWSLEQWVRITETPNSGLGTIDCIKAYYIAYLPPLPHPFWSLS